MLTNTNKRSELDFNDLVISGLSQLLANARAQSKRFSFDDGVLIEYKKEGHFKQMLVPICYRSIQHVQGLRGDM